MKGAVTDACPRTFTTLRLHTLFQRIPREGCFQSNREWQRRSLRKVRSRLVVHRQHRIEATYIELWEGFGLQLQPWGRGFAPGQHCHFRVLTRADLGVSAFKWYLSGLRELSSML